MQLLTILENLASKNSSKIIKTVESSVYILDVTFPKEIDEYYIMYLGQTFRNKNNKVFELFYECKSHTLVRQIVATNYKKFLGQICGYDHVKSYVNQAYCTFFSGVSSNSEKFKVLMP